MVGLSVSWLCDMAPLRAGCDMTPQSPGQATLRTQSARVAGSPQWCAAGGASPGAPRAHSGCVTALHRETQRQLSDHYRATYTTTVATAGLQGCQLAHSASYGCDMLLER